MSHDFVALVLPYRKELLAYATRLCQSRSLAEDVVQESLLKAMESWERFRVPPHVAPEVAVRSWLYTVTHNYFVTTWRKVKRTQQVSEALAETEVFQSHEDPREALDGYSMEVESALLELDDDQRRVVVLATRGLSYKEIAAELGLPIGTVMSRLCRARRNLELQLADYAAQEYGLHRTRKDADPGQAAECPEPEPSGVDGVVGGLADLALRR